jgi:hypothetical protein
MEEEFLYLDSQDASLPGDFKNSNTIEEDEELRMEENFGKEKDKDDTQRLQARLLVV